MAGCPQHEHVVDNRLYILLELFSVHDGLRSNPLVHARACAGVFFCTATRQASGEPRPGRNPIALEAYLFGCSTWGAVLARRKIGVIIRNVDKGGFPHKRCGKHTKMVCSAHLRRASSLQTCRSNLGTVLAEEPINETPNIRAYGSLRDAVLAIACM